MSYYSQSTEENLKSLVGRTVVSIDRSPSNDDFRMTLRLSDGSEMAFIHQQDCCEDVHIADICGELSDLVGSPITQADEEMSGSDPDGYKRDYPPESMTWTFYRISTAKGQVVIRWIGESNGYYSERVDFTQTQ
jgi:hypothetical protein